MCWCLNLLFQDECPHEQGPLFQEIIVHGSSGTYPLRSWKIDFANGEMPGPDEGCTSAFSAKIENGQVYIEFA